MFRLLVFLLFCYVPAVAQTLTGRVLDAQTGQPVPFASVFVNGTARGTLTDSTGQFRLALLPGPQPVVARAVGYQPQTQTLDAAQTPTATFRLAPDAQLLTEVTATARRDKIWEGQLARFQRAFLGDDVAARQCRILNPWVLMFSEEGGRLTARAPVALEIDNPHLGYLLAYSLRNFQSGSGEVRFSGYVQFTAQWPPNAETQRRWATARQAAYAGSELDLLRSLIARKAALRGFEGYLDKPGHDPNTRAPFFHQQQALKLQAVSLDSIVRVENVPNGYRLTLPKRIEIHATRAEGPFTIYRDKPAPVSWLDTRGPLLVSAEGVLRNPDNWSVSGFLASGRAARLLPLDYQPTDAPAPVAAASPERYVPVEQPYFVLDKPAYAPGDTVRLAGRLLGPALRSKLLYVELLHGTTGRLVLRQRVAVEEAQFETAVPLPDSARGTYWMRTFTRWGLNWGDTLVTGRWVHVLPAGEQLATLPRLDGPGLDDPELNGPASDNPALDVSLTDSTVIATLPRPDGPAPAWLTATLTPSARGAFSSSDTWPGNATLPKSLAQPRYVAETGVTLAGQLLDKKGRAITEGQVLLVIPKTKQSFIAQPDTLGRFTFENLPIEGEQSALLRATMPNGKPVARLLLDADTLPLLPRPPQPPTLLTRPADATSATLVRPAGSVSRTVALQEVRVRANRAPVPPKSMYKQADYVLTGEELTRATVGENILVALQGRVPGLRVVERFDEAGLRQLIITLRGGMASTITQNKPPLVLVDGVPFEDVNQLTVIPPSRVERIEVVNRADALLGLRGYTGVISVFTKQTPDVVLAETDPAIVKTVLHGLAPTPSPAPFWQPNVAPTPVGWTVRFSRPSQPGRYYVAFRGVTAGGRAVQWQRAVLVSAR